MDWVQRVCAAFGHLAVTPCNTVGCLFIKRTRSWCRTAQVRKGDHDDLDLSLLTGDADAVPWRELTGGFAALIVDAHMPCVYRLPRQVARLEHACGPKPLVYANIRAIV